MMLLMMTIIIIVIIIIIIIIIIVGVMSQPLRGVPAFTKNRHSKSFDLCS